MTTPKNRRHTIATFADRDLAQGGNRLVCFFHIPKTGGTTLGRVLTEGFAADRKLIFWGVPEFAAGAGDGDPHPTAQFHGSETGAGYVLVEDYWHWIRLRDLHRTFDGADLLLEGYTFGAEHLFGKPRNVFNVTQLREPLRVFRSNFSYARANYTLNESMEEFLLNHFANNVLVNTLARGDLELAKDRLESEFAVFGITEEFKKSVQLIGGYFGFHVDSFTQMNKSESDRFELDDRIVDMFEEKNRKDREFYEFAQALFRRRCAESPWFESEDETDDVTEIIDEVRSFPTKGRHEKDPVIQLMDSGKYRDAVAILLANPERSMGYFRALARCFERLGDPDYAWQYYEEAFNLRAAENINTAIPFFIATDPDRALAIIDRELEALESLIFETPPDSMPYNILVTLTGYKMDALDRLGRPEDGIYVLEREIDRMRARGVSLAVNAQFIRELAHLMNLLARAYQAPGLEENDEITAKSQTLQFDLQELQYEIMLADIRGRGISIPEREFELCILLGDISLGRGDFCKAEKWLRNATSIDSGSMLAHIRLSDVLERQGKSSEAAAVMREAMAPTGA